jgi:hypothetical protein
VTAVVAMAGLAIAAMLERRTAIEQRDTALSRQLAAQSGARLTVNRELSLLLAAEAARLKPTREAEEALRQAVMSSALLARPDELKDIEWSATSGARQVSPDGLVEASGVANVAVLRDAKTGRLIREMRGHSTDVETLRFSEDGRFLEGEGEGAGVFVWRTSPVSRIAALRHRARVHAAVLSPDGTRVMTTTPQGVTIWDLAKGQQVASLSGRGAGFTRDGRSVVTSLRASRLWRTARYGSRARNSAATRHRFDPRCSVRMDRKC